MTPIEKDKLDLLCKKWGLTELNMSKGIFMAGDNSGITMNLRSDVPIVGITIAGTLHMEGHGNLKVQDLQTEVDHIMKTKPIPKLQSSSTKDAQKQSNGEIKQKGGQESPLPKKSTTSAICDVCHATFGTTLDTISNTVEKYGKIVCPACIEKEARINENEVETSKTSADKKTKGNVPATSKPETKVIKTCKTCGLELSGARALYCFQKDPQKPEMICEECEDHKTTIMQSEEKTKSSAIPARQPDARIPVQAYTPQGSIIKGFQPSLKEIGKIKIGGKGEERHKQGGGTYRIPVKFDHFEITSLIRDEKGDFMKDHVMDILDEKPQSIDILLLFNDPTLNFVSWYAQYQGGKCLCKGDGVTARQADGAQIECSPDTCPQYAAKKCKPNGILSVILTKSPRLGGVYKFRTTSYNSIRSILSSMFFLSSITGGVLAMIPLKLTVSPMQVQPKDSAHPQTIYVVNIEFSGTAPELLEKTFEIQKYQGAMRESIIKLESTARAVLTAPESREEINDIEAEYYPEQQKVTKS